MSDATATIRVYRLASRPTWHYTDPTDGRRLSTGFTERHDAEAFVKQLTFARTQHTKQQAGGTVASLLAAYLKIRQRKITPGGAERLAYAHKALVAHFGDWSPDRLDNSACYDYRDQRMETVASRTIRTELEALRAAVKWGMTKEGGRVVEQMPDLWLPEKGEGRVRWLTRAEADRLLSFCTLKHLRLFVEIGLNTGARSGAILAMTWDRVDFAERTIDFRTPDEVVTKKRKVVQAMNDDLYAVLTEAKTRATCDYVVEWAGDRVRSIKHGYASAVERAGLDGAVTPHTMRHTVITWMLQSGVPIWEVSNFAGMTVQLIETTYSHATVASKRRAAKALERKSQQTAKAA